MTALIPWLQALTALSWVLVAMLMARPAWRYLRYGEAIHHNVRAVLFAFIALTQVGFSIRWWMFSDAVQAMGGTEASLWAALYLLNCIGALAMVAANRRGLFDK